jgi:hypothetical protein
MSSERSSSVGRLPDAGWPLAEMLVDHWVVIPDEARGRLVAAALAKRGHRWVRVRPVYLPHLDPRNRLYGKPEFSRPELEGWWQVRSVVDEQAADRDAEFYQQACERIAVAAIGRAHGGFHEGGLTAHRQTLMSHLDLDGLVHELSEDQAFRLRHAAVATFPPQSEPLRPVTPLRFPDGRTLPPLLDSVREVARRLQAEGRMSEVTAWWLTDEADDFEDDRQLLFELADSVMHQGTCYAHTASEMPLLAGLAVDEAVHPVFRSCLLVFLAEAGTIGQRLVAGDADRRIALGAGLDESEPERATRRAVEAAAPGLLARWGDECEAVRFGLAALAAVCPNAARSSGVIAPIVRMADEASETHRATALRLAAHLAEDDEDVLAVALTEAIGTSVINPDDVPSPNAPVRGAALSVLKSMLEQEISLLLQA